MAAVARRHLFTLPSPTAVTPILIAVLAEMGAQILRANVLAATTVASVMTISGILVAQPPIANLGGLVPTASAATPSAMAPARVACLLLPAKPTVPAHQLCLANRTPITATIPPGVAGPVVNVMATTAANADVAQIARMPTPAPPTIVSMVIVATPHARRRVEPARRP